MPPRSAPPRVNDRPVNEAAERLQRGAELVESWGSAVRGDWFDFDGRVARDTMRGIAAFLRGERDDDPLFMVVCRAGTLGPHWYGSDLDHNCDDALAATSTEEPSDE